MARFETTADRVAQSKAARKIELSWSYKIVETGDLDFIDFLIYRDDKLQAVAEYKRRHIFKNDYPTYIISARKYDFLLDHSRSLGLVGLIFVEWNDGLHFVRVEAATGCDRAMGGRPPRGGAVNDIELMLHIPVEMFCHVGG